MKTKRLLFISLIVAICCSQSVAQPTTFYPRGIGGGGSLFFPRINPANDNEFYVACDMSEMFHSTDFGKTYSQIHFSKLQALNVSTYEFTNDSMVAYSNFNDGNNGYPVKTTDGGNTWTQLPGYDASSGQVYAMTANYNNKNQLLMNYYNSIVISNDGGTTFNTVATATTSATGITMGGVFFDGVHIYLGTNQGLYYSNNSGVSFSLMSTSGIPSSQTIWSFAGAKSGSTTRFVCITGSSTGTYCGLMPWDYYGFAKGVYTMDNANGIWLSKVSGITLSNDYIMYAGMATNDINTIYLGGNDQSTGGALVYKSANGGSSWSKVFKSDNNQNIYTGWSGYQGDKNWSWGETTFGITVAPNNSGKVMFGDYGFIHLTSDGGANWQQAYVKSTDQHPEGAATPTQQTYHSIGLENTSCWQVTWQSPNVMMAAYSDIGGIRSTDGGNSWGFTYNGISANSIYRIAATPGGTMFAGTSGIHDMYQSTRLKDAQLDAADGNGKILYSTDKGANWNLLHTFGHPVFWLAIDPNDSNKMYASVINYGGTGTAGGIWMTSNLNNLASATWTLLPAPPRTEGHPACITVLNDGKVLCTYSGRINGTTGQFTASSGVFLYDPGTNSWSDLSDVNMHYWTKDVIVDPSDPAQNTWYACVFSHWGSTASGQGGLYKTIDRGISWTKLTGNQFDRVTSIAFTPQNPKQAFLTTETQGLWVSNDMDSTAPTFSLVNSYPFRQPERVYFDPYDTTQMWVTSFGNGMKAGALSGSLSVPVFHHTNSSLSAYPNPTHNIIYVNIPPGQASSYYIYIYNSSGRLINQVAIDNKRTVALDMHNWPAGLYWLSYGNATATVIKE